MTADVLVDLGTGMAIIGVMIVLFLRADSRIDKLDAKFESRIDTMDAKFDVMARDVVGVKISVARIEGYLQARDGLAPWIADSPLTLLPFPSQNSSARSLALLIDVRP